MCVQDLPDNLEEDVEGLSSLLRFHVVPEELTDGDLNSDLELPTLDSNRRIHLRVQHSVGIELSAGQET
jgi:hypothetical protein